MQTAQQLQTASVPRQRRNGRNVALPRDLFVFYPEMWAILLVLAFFNWRLLQGGHAESFVVTKTALADGEWWRLLTAPFVHLTWYHILSDVSTCLCFYASMGERRVAIRLLYFTAAALGGTLTGFALGNLSATVPLCGLSSVVYAMLAISGINLIRNHGRLRLFRNVGILFVAYAIMSTSIEAATGVLLDPVSAGIVALQPVLNAVWHGLTGRPPFSLASTDLVATPIVVCHIGGVLAVLACFCVVVSCERARRPALPCSRLSGVLAQAASAIRQSIVLAKNSISSFFRSFFGGGKSP